MIKKYIIPTLPPRLAAIADGVSKLGRQDIIYDVGTDHALLPIYLIKTGLCAEAAASDVSGRSLSRARKNAEAYGVTAGINFYEGDGFSPLIGYLPGKAVIIAGIGGKNLTEIINKGGNMARSASFLILQPMSGQEILREWLFGNSFDIVYERLAREGNRIYSVLFCKNAIQTDVPQAAPQAQDPHANPQVHMPHTNLQAHAPYDIYLGKNVVYDTDSDYIHFLKFTRLKVMNRLNGLSSKRKTSAERDSTGCDSMETERLKIIICEIDRRISQKPVKER